MMAATVWRGRITFGLVSIPVRLYKAARREHIRFRRVQRVPAEERAAAMGSVPAFEEEEPYEAPAEVPRQRAPGLREAEAAEPGPRVERVRSAPVSGPENQPVAPAEVLKGYEVAKDQYVVLEQHEVAALRPRTSTELEIAEFVELEEIDPVYFDVSYHVAPDAGGEKPYALLFRALEESGEVGIGSLAMHGREYATVIRPARGGLMLHTLFYSSEIAAAGEFHTDTPQVSAKELELAKLLIHALSAKFDPTRLKDTYEERLRELIETRSATPSAASSLPPQKTPAVDIAEALRKSLERMRKPARREQDETAKPKRRRAR